MTTPKTPPPSPPPSLTHEEASARLVELVYGEGAPAEREALEAHVATCARCEAELAALGDTRAQLRVALDDVPVPARAHARILEAARAAVAPQIAAAAPALARPAPSFWERMRGKWTLPTLATAGAVAILIVGSKVLLDPQRAQRQVTDLREPARQENGQGSAPAAPEPVPAASARAVAPQAQPEGEPAENAPAAAAFDPLRGKSTLSPAAQAAFDRARGTFGPHHDGILGQLGTPHLGPRYGAIASRAIANARQLGMGSGGGAVAPGGAVARGGDEPAPAKAAPSAAVEADKAAAASAELAAPVALAKKKAATAETTRAKSDTNDSLQEAEGAAGAAPAAAPAPAPMADLFAKPAAAEAPKDEAAAPPPYAAPARRADQLYAGRRWPEAVAAYRDLLRRWPDAAPAKRWRARLAEARGEAAGTAAPAATTK